MTDLPKMRFADDGTPLPFTEQEIDTLIPLVAQQLAPRRFALCEVDRDPDGQPFDVHVLAWGIETGLEDDSVSIFGYPDSEGRALRGSFSSPELAVRFLRAGDVRIAWVDNVPG